LGNSVTVAGLVTDDGPLGGLTVYYSSDVGHSFTTQTTLLGAFASPAISIAFGSQISVYTIDSDGNQSATMLLIV
jgi:hypothetical protein